MICTEWCYQSLANNGVCNDEGNDPLCPYGSDCADCGPREVELHPPPPPSPLPPPFGGSNCFARAVATACRLAAPLVNDADALKRAHADCFGADSSVTSSLNQSDNQSDYVHDDHASAASVSRVGSRVRMADLKVGDLLLAADTSSSYGETDGLGDFYADTVMYIDAADEPLPLVTLHHASGSLTLTPQHGVWAGDGMLEAGNVHEGASLLGSDGARIIVEQWSTSNALVINPVVCRNRVLAADGDGAPILATTMSEKYAGLCDAK